MTQPEMFAIWLMLWGGTVYLEGKIKNSTIRSVIGNIAFLLGSVIWITAAFPLQ